MDIRNVAVFCGSNMGDNPVFQERIIMLADSLIQEGWGLVYGGGHRGLMGEISQYMLEHGVDSMHQRKALMYEKADAFIIFPGGIGTLDEYAEISTWHQIGFSGKPVAVLDINGFYDGLKILIDNMITSGFIKESTRADYFFSEEINEIISYFKNYEYVKGKWES